MTKYIAFSGGKDSTALALLMPDAIPVFTDTGAEFPELYRHIEKFEKITGRTVKRLYSKHGTLLEYIEKTKYLPGHGARYCTRLFKIELFNEISIKYSVAIRADEKRTGNFNSKVNYPLIEMGIGLNDVIEICLKNELLPRYPVYMARGGCINCFYKRKSEIQAMNDYRPDILDKLEKLENYIQDQRGKYALMFPNTGQSIRNIRRQKNLFSKEEIYRQAANKSDYGTACGIYCNR